MLYDKPYVKIVLAHCYAWHSHAKQWFFNSIPPVLSRQFVAHF